ncbi:MULTISPECIES: XRE family transcriptional regulator [Streptomyces]|uniref:Uncharacterized protein n=1 Tax=Streptomyces albus (strain ATCC 21838 / DSM 41398 / FERM P-419 / JCM 4703 / NBRC 107858) TaxID=1081613 RepID=A0A0B5F0L5_STRA4|nr:XRE family transcriptional regulator [Streptomyces sp. SCSIO ZS0520]AJE83842.1 hypothetical protein SLNWT_3466 [Streptomyces albus]AOU78147.1 hypothetical protein SLNHY_3456 [Streptomyces albus]AYN33902.1 hypothetical protein DUI70_3401 [Streptomyces albus]
MPASEQVRNESETFAVALRKALRAGSLPLDRVCERLALRGVRITPATLSYWQCGRTRPERPESLRALEEVEALLDLPAGSLTALVGPPRPRRRPVAGGDFSAATYRVYGRDSWQEGLLGPRVTRVNRDLAFLLTQESLRLDEHGCIRTVRVHHVVKALRGGAQELGNFCELDGRPFEIVPHCGQLGEVVHGENSGALLRFGFGRKLEAGETAVVDYEILAGCCAAPRPFYLRGIRRVQDVYTLQVHFHPDRVPVRAVTHFQENFTAPRTRVRPVRLDGSGCAHLYRAKCPPGVHGLSWN